MSLDLTPAIDGIAALAEANCPRDNEYMDEETGLLKCRLCGGPRQTIVQPPFEGARPRTVRCMCKCPTHEDRRKQIEHKDALDRARSVCFKGSKYTACTFDTDDRKKPELSDTCRQYAEQFTDHMKNGLGLLLYGPVGTGKTHLAACVANAVIDQGRRALMMNMSTVADELWNVEDKAGYIRDMCRYDLMILDDLGVERKTPYMQEMVYKILNARYESGRPVIITTNLTPDELTKTADPGYIRTYDRLLENCLPLKVDGPSRRRKAAAETWGRMRKQLGMEATP